MMMGEGIPRVGNPQQWRNFHLELGYEIMKYLNTIKFGMGMVVGLNIFCCACAGTSPTTKSLAKAPAPPIRVDEGEGVRLSQALQNNLKTEKMAPEHEKLLKEILRAYSGKKKQKLSLDQYESCKTRFKNAPECLFLKPAWSDSWLETEDELDVSFAQPEKKAESNPSSKSTHRKHKKVINLLVAQLKKGIIQKVKDQHEGDYYRVFKQFKEWTPELQSLSQKLLSEKECYDSEVYNYLGMKAEMFYPNAELLKTTTQLYRKVDECALANPAISMNKYVQNARFRLGLLLVMQNDCASANLIFTKLTKGVVSDYSSRAYYWKAYCAKSDAKQDVYLSNYEELFKMNPLGFHTLSMNHGTSPLSQNLLKPVDPIIQTRAKGVATMNATLNSWIGILEDYDRMGEYAAVRKLLLPIKKNPEYLTSLEPGVRLYLSTFAMRARDTLSLFRILDSVFRTQSEYVVDSTMKLFYPMKHLDFIASQVKRVNPFLITALIRQESAFQEEAHSKVGAVGLMQLMPATARIMSRGVKRKQLFQAETNIKIGVRYFESLVDRFKGDVELALASYNAGPEVVDQWQKRYPMKNKLLFLDLIPYSETRNYVALIGRNYYWYSKLYSDQIKQEPGIAQRNPVVFEALQ